MEPTENFGRGRRKVVGVVAVRICIAPSLCVVAVSTEYVLGG